MVGRLVESKAGHDNKKRYNILHEDEKYVYITDGRLHPLEKPKKKNKKHIVVLQYDIEEIRRAITQKERRTNEMIKHAIKVSKRDDSEKEN